MVMSEYLDSPYLFGLNIWMSLFLVMTFMDAEYFTRIDGFH